MWLRRSWIISRQEFQILKADPGFIVVFVALPILVIGFVKPTFSYVLHAQGLAQTNGAEQAVPGMAVMFALFLISFVGYAFFREHGWGTWERLRVSAATPLNIVVGKAFPHVAIVVGQVALIFAAGILLFDLRIEGSLIGLGLIILAFAAAVTSMGMALVALCSTVQQLDMFSSFLALILSGIGGALIPLSTLPAWARSLARLTPSFWAMQGFQSVIFAKGLQATLVPFAVLLLFTAIFTLVAVSRFRIDEKKVSWA